MTADKILNNDIELDLILQRQIDVPKDKVWKALTEPELVKEWFCPKPWKTTECRIDLRPGGEFYTNMQGPDGEGHSGASCFLEIVPQERLVWTTSLQPGYRPSPLPATDAHSCESLMFTCIITLAEKDGGTKYVAHVMHSTPEQKIQHEEMGFEEGWGATITQLEELLKHEKV
ncbi:MAG: polyketide cyclase [Alphaproteobacteria bacterium CG_4_9_14_3_um_filter_47_13]|nr:MAG: polyketide cyclase [Alphaproteobacteria bacterium CG_4_9_14_3_um_filter_47_13]